MWFGSPAPPVSSHRAAAESPTFALGGPGPDDSNRMWDMGAGRLWSRKSTPSHTARVGGAPVTWISQLLLPSNRLAAYLLRQAIRSDFAPAVELKLQLACQEAFLRPDHASTTPFPKRGPNGLLFGCYLPNAHWLRANSRILSRHQLSFNCPVHLRHGNGH